MNRGGRRNSKGLRGILCGPASGSGVLETCLATHRQFDSPKAKHGHALELESVAVPGYVGAAIRPRHVANRNIDDTQT